MATEPGAATIDPGDFDAIGVMAEIVVMLRRHAIERDVDVTALVSAPPGRHVLRIAARTSGHVLLGVRYDGLTPSRRNVIAAAFSRRDWDLDEDAEGVTRCYAPGTEPAAIAFEALAVLTLGGTSAEPRTVSAMDAAGSPVELR
jgi:hypothetical protein